MNACHVLLEGPKCFISKYTQNLSNPWNRGYWVECTISWCEGGIDIEILQLPHAELLPIEKYNYVLAIISVCNTSRKQVDQADIKQVGCSCSVLVETCIEYHFVSNEGFMIL